MTLCTCDELSDCQAHICCSNNVFYYFIGALQNESESIFDYSLTNGNYLLYNDHHSKPRFLEDLVGNLTALFSNSSKAEVETYTSTCMGNKHCLLAIARTGKLNEGERVMDAYHQKQYKQEVIGNVSIKKCAVSDNS